MQSLEGGKIVHKAVNRGGKAQGSDYFIGQLILTGTVQIRQSLSRVMMRFQKLIKFFIPVHHHECTS